MTPKEKAINLVDRFMLRIIFNIKQNIELCIIESAKECALLSVDAIMQECSHWIGGTNDGWDTKRFEYWQEVKKEIENL